MFNIVELNFGVCVSVCVCVCVFMCLNIDNIFNNIEIRLRRFVSLRIKLNFKNFLVCWIVKYIV